VKSKLNISAEQLKKDYNDLKSINAVARKYNVDSGTIKSRLIKFKIKYKPALKYNCDWDFFSKDTEESFYWAGFIVADGCVKVRKSSHGYGKEFYEMSIGLSIIDENHLDKFKQCLQSNHPVKNFKVKGRSYKGNQYSETYKSEITIVSKKICDDLLKFNVVPRKSLIYNYPEWIIGHPLENHFVRGYFDGDGSLYASKSKNKKTEQFHFNVLGTENCLKNIKNFLNLMESVSKIRKIKNIYSLDYGGNNLVKKICKILYENSSIFLKRKYEKYLNLLNYTTLS
jgi:hypothetical protein